MVVIGRSLLIFSDVTFKMAAWWPYWNFWFPDSNFSLALNINSKLKWHNTYIYRQKPIDFQRCHYQNGCLAAILDFLVSGLTLVWLWKSTPNSVAKYLCIWVRTYWFSVTSFSKWLFGGHIKFFGFWMAWFRQCNSSLRWNFSFKFHVHVLCGCRQKPNGCQLCCFQNGCLVILNNVQLQSTHCPLPPFPMGRGYPSRSQIYNF